MRSSGPRTTTWTSNEFCFFTLMWGIFIVFYNGHFLLIPLHTPKDTNLQGCLYFTAKQKEQEPQFQMRSYVYRRPLNNTSLNCVGPLTLGFFSIVNTVVLHNPWLVQSMDTEPQIWRANCKLYSDFGLCREAGSLTPALFKGQLYIFLILLVIVCQVAQEK